MEIVASGRAPTQPVDQWISHFATLNPAAASISPAVGHPLSIRLLASGQDHIGVR